MPQDTAPKARPATDDAATDDAIRRIMNDATAETVPETLVELAEKLERLLAAKRSQKPQETG